MHGQEEGRQLPILRRLSPDKFRNHQRCLPCAGRERCSRQSPRRQVLCHNRLVVWLLAARYDTTCPRKVSILHQARALPVHQDALRPIQRTSLILSDLLYVCCICYLDDIIVFGETPEQLMENMHRVFTRLKEKGLKAKPPKSVLLRSPIDFLGHIVSADGDSATA